MDLHGKIMNLPTTRDAENAEYSNRREAYMNGHRDARHAAAELSNAADADRVVLIEVALNAVGAYEALRTVGASRHLPGLAHCEARLKEVLKRVGAA